MTDFRNTTVNRTINVDGNFNITLNYIIIQFRELDETLNAIYRLNAGNQFSRIESNITTQNSISYSYKIFDKYVDINNVTMPSNCPNHNEIYYAKYNTITVPKKSYIEATAYGTSNQSMIYAFVINSSIPIYMKDTTYSSYIVKPIVTPQGNNNYNVSFKIQNLPYTPGTTTSFTQNMVLYKNSSCTQAIISTPITFEITNTSTPIGD